MKKINKILLVTILLCSLLLTIIMSSAYPITETTVQTNVNTNPGYTATHIIRDYKNNIYYILYTKGTVINLWLAKSTDNGSTWSNTQITSDPRSQTYCAIAIDSNGNLYAIIEGYNDASGYPEIRFTKSTDKGVTWTSLITLTNTDYGAFSPTIAVDSNDKLHISYQLRDNVTLIREIAYQNSTNGGTTWSSKRILYTDGVTEGFSPYVTVDNSNNVFIAYTNIKISTCNIYCANSSDSGKTWTLVNVTKSTSANSQNDPRITISQNGSLFLAWSRYWGSTAYIGFSRSYDHGKTWSSITNITYGGSAGSQFITRDYTGVLHLLYSHYTVAPLKFALFYRNSTDNGTTWSLPVNLTDNSTTRKYNSIPMDATFPVYNNVPYNKPYKGYFAIYIKNTTASNYNLISIKSTNPLLLMNANPPIVSFNATKIYDHYADFNATVVNDNNIVDGCNMRIQMLNITNYPNWNKATNTTWSGYKKTGGKAYWNHTTLQGNTMTRPGMKFYYRVQSNNTYNLNNSTIKTFMSQPEATDTVIAVPDYDNFTSRLQLYISMGGQSSYDDRHVVNYKTTGYPTSPTDGTRIYNGSLYPYTLTLRDYKIPWTNETTYNSKIYLSIWAFTYSGNYSRYSNATYAIAYTPKQNFNKVFMNTTTLITPTTARLNVYARSAGLTNYLRCEYGLTTAYGTNTAFITGVRNGSYTFNLTGLTPGKLYYVRARINNTANTNYSTSPSYFRYNKTGIGAFGSWSAGLLPDYIFNYNTTLSSRCVNTTFQPYAGNINIIWTYDHTLYPAGSAWDFWVPGDGCSYQMSGNRRELWMVLSSNFTQRIIPTRDAWKYAFLTTPNAPTITSHDIYYDPLQPIGESPYRLRVNWTKGTGANRTLLISSSTHFPTSPTDGTVRYNGTGTTTNIGIYQDIPCFVSLFSFTTWTYNPTLSSFSSNYSSLNWSSIGVNCYNESNPSQSLIFNVMFKNENGTIVYTAYNVSNTYLLNISEIPIGDDILIKVWRTGYRERFIYKTVINSTYYYIDFYLPPIETNQGETGDCITKTAVNSINITYSGKDVNITFSHTPGDIISVERYNSSVDRTLRSFTDSKTVSNHSRDLWIPLTYTKENIISVNIWNDSLYGSYGGWYPVASNKYSYVSGNNTIRINETVLDKNTTIGQVNYYYWGGGTYGAWQFIPETKYTKYSTYLRINKTALDSYITMARVTYYYQDCPGIPTKTALYNIRVVETIKTEFSEFDRPITNARVSIQVYINTSGIYKNITTLLSDSNGYCSAWLIPGTLYQIIAICDGYDRYRAEYQALPPNQYGQVSDKLIRLTRSQQEIPTSSAEQRMDGITWTIQPTWWRQTGAFNVWFNITSSNCKLEWYRIDIYNYNYSTNTWTLYGSDNDSNPCGGSVTYLIPNSTGKWTVSAWFKKQNFSAYEVSQEGSFTYFVTKLQQWLQDIPDYAFYIVLLVIMLIVMGYCMMSLGTGLLTGYIGLGIMALGFLLHPITLEVSRTFSIDGWAIWGITFIFYTIILFIYSRI